MHDITSNILKTLNCDLNPLGMEVGLFKVGWYNENVSNAFKLDYDANTVCAVVITLPSFFEKVFIPYVKNSFKNEKVEKDLIDKCISSHLEAVTAQFSQYNLVSIYDYDMLPNRRPKVLVQTAAHVAGLAYYYQKSSLADKSIKEKLYGVSIHPVHGGWFAMRSVIIFTQLQDESLCYKEPLDVLPTDELRLNLLRKFTTQWKDKSYRDVILVKEKYSELQIKYFDTLPKHRLSLLKEILIL